MLLCYCVGCCVCRVFEYFECVSCCVCCAAPCVLCCYCLSVFVFGLCVVVRLQWFVMVCVAIVQCMMYCLELCDDV